MDAELSTLRIAAGIGLALGSKLVVELAETTLESKDTGIGRLGMAGGVKGEKKNGVRNASNCIRIQIWKISPDMTRF